MKIELIRATCIAGNGCEAGQVVDVNEATANLLIGMKKGQPYEPKTAPIENRSVGLETSEEKPRRKGKNRCSPKI